MAVYRWRGTSSNAWETSGNWVNEAGSVYSSGYPGSVTGVEDEVYLDALATTALGAYDASAKEVMARFVVGQDYGLSGLTAADIGTSVANRVIIHARQVIIDGGDYCGNIYIKGHTSGTGITSLTVVDMPTGKSVYVDGDTDTVAITKGTVVYAASSSIATALTTSYASDSTGDVSLTLGETMTLPSTINCNGGTVDCSTAITTLNVNAGAWTQTTGAITTLNLGGGSFAWTDGAITTANLYAGTFSGAASDNPRRIGTVNIYPSASCDIDNGSGNIYVTSKIVQMGGTFSAGSNYQLAQYRTETYAGASDANMGISPQTLNNSNVDGDEVYIGPYDHVTFYCTVGAMAASSVATFLAKEASASGGSFSDISGKSAAFDASDDNKTKLIDVWGYELTAGKPYVKVNCAESGTADAIVCCVYVKRTI